MAGNKLTPKQRAFVREYQLDLNGTQAAIRAGYSARTAAVQAHRMLRKANIKAAIEDGQRRLAAKTEITKDHLLTQLRQIVACEDGAVSQTNRIRAIAEINKMLGFYVTESKVAPTFKLNLHMGRDTREQPADAENPEALPEKSRGS